MKQIFTAILTLFAFSLASSQMIIDMPYGTYGHCTETINNNLFIIGGSYGDKMKKYNFKTKKWSDASSPFSKIRFSTSERINNEIYVFGGYGSKSDVQVYNIKKDKWQYLSNNKIPTGIQWSTSESYKNKIYLIGGYHSDAEDGKGLNQIQVFDIKDNTWEVFDIPMDNLRTPNSLINKNIIYIWEYRTLNTFNIDTRKWDKVNLPDNVILNNQEGIIHNNSILFIGGTDGTHKGATPSNSIIKLDLEDYSISKLKYKLKFLRQYEFGTFIYRNQLYLVGGRDYKSWESISKIEVVEKIK